MVFIILIFIVYFLPMLVGMKRLYDIINNPQGFCSSSLIKEEAGWIFIVFLIPVLNIVVLIDFLVEHDRTASNKKSNLSYRFNKFVYNLLKEKERKDI